jgi:hypothetical protein
MYYSTTYTNSNSTCIAYTNAYSDSESHTESNSWSTDSYSDTDA